MERLFVFLFLCVSTLSFSQAKWDHTWVLGYDGNYTGTPEIGEGFILDFNGPEVEPVFLDKHMSISTNCISMSSAGGELRFYSNGCFINDREHGELQNGGGINPGTWHENFCAYGYPLNQGMLAIPKPGHEEVFSILHSAYADNPNYADRLYYSEIDTEGNGGLGEVVEKNTVLTTDSLWSGYLTGARHADNEKWWVLAQRAYSNRFIKILLDSSGAEIVGEQEIGLTSEIAGAAGQAVFSPDGAKYVWLDPLRNVQLFDFDRETGVLSNFQQLNASDTIYFGGAAISSNSRFLYVSDALKLYQFDLEAQDIQASKVVVGVFDGLLSPVPANFNLMQLAPDCRIYMSTGNGTDRMHVIDHPNKKGADCGFRQHALQLPSYNAGSLPNHPNYRLGTGLPVCDSTIQLVTGTVRVRPPVQQARIYPNPASGHLTVELPVPLASPGRWRLYSAVGAEVLEAALPPGQVRHGVELGALPAGLYFWETTVEGRKMGGGKLVISK